MNILIVAIVCYALISVVHGDKKVTDVQENELFGFESSDSTGTFNSKTTSSH